MSIREWLGNMTMFRSTMDEELEQENLLYADVRGQSVLNLHKALNETDAGRQLRKTKLRVREAPVDSRARNP
nr:hypothetical protein 31 [Saccharospirillaceae bacterium]